MAQNLNGLDFNSIKLSDLDGKFIVIKYDTALGTTFNTAYSKLNNVFYIKGKEAFDYEAEVDEKGKLTGKWVQAKSPIVQISDDSKSITYLASRFVENPYVTYTEPHTDKVMGDAGVAMLQAIKLFLQSYSMVAFDAYLADERELVSDIISGDGVTTTTTVAPTTTTTTTTTTTVAPTTTTTTVAPTTTP